MGYADQPSATDGVYEATKRNYKPASKDGFSSALLAEAARRYYKGWGWRFPKR